MFRCQIQLRLMGPTLCRRRGKLQRFAVDSLDCSLLPVCGQSRLHSFSSNEHLAYVLRQDRNGGRFQQVPYWYRGIGGC